MNRAKTIDSSRPSIFDDLKEKYPELAKAGSVEPPPARTRAPWVVFALLALLGTSALGLYIRTRNSPSAPHKAPALSLIGQTEPVEERARATAKLQLPTPPLAPPVGTAKIPANAPAIEQALEDLEPPLPTDSAPGPALLAPKPPKPPVRKPAPTSPKGASLFPGAEEAALCDAADLRNPVKLSWSAPEYPETARQAFQEGLVVVEAQVDDEGTVESVRILRGATPELGQAALEAVSIWRFEPATCAGRPVAGRYRTALHFDLTSKEQTEATADTTTNSTLEPPVRLFAPQPTYPPTEWVAAIEGDVTLKATIDEAGLVAAVEVLKGVSPGLDEAAVQALERWRFRPARRGDELVRFEQVLTFRFRR